MTSPKLDIVMPKQKKSSLKRRPSFDIARSFVEMNFAVLMESELTPKELKKKRKAEAKAERKAEKQRHHVRNAILSLLALLLICAGIAITWWTTSLRPVDPGDTEERQFIVDKGVSTDQVATALQKAGFIRNALAFKIYARLNNTTVQAGTHYLSPSYSVPEIAEKLTKAVADELEIQIPPGLALSAQPGAEITTLRDVFKKYGYTDEEIDAAYSATYESSLFDGRPDDLPIKNRLEGYIYPDTYRIYNGDKLETLIRKALDQFELVAAKNDLAAKFAAHGLNFYEGVTLASIVIKEVSNTEDQKTAASVFYNRLHSGIVLGSDVTYHYAYSQGYCELNTPACDSVYNTRQRRGLPPSPISNVNLASLTAVAYPAETDYYYFVSGDGADTGKTFFSRTESEHEANRRAHCRELCR
ncbi:endolytic transglycosylase MltG [Candidatus Saccharibacteria bacterium]|nr:endolytic transglycosylase MltG [Candidatus Saccharibacteria bacterium]